MVVQKLSKYTWSSDIPLVPWSNSALNKALFKFDFFVNNSYLIEYDGDIHFSDTKTRGWYSSDYQNQIQQFDQLKNEWCKNNNIPLIRIPYTHLKELCIEDLLLETSQFIVNKNEEVRVNAC